MTARTLVVTDSTAGVLDGDGVTVVVLDVVLDGAAHPETGLAVTDLLARLRAGARVTTSRPSPGAFVAAYEGALAAGVSAVVSVHLAGSLSGTVEAARLAARQVGVRVEVVDSRTAAAALAVGVNAARLAAADGGGVRSVADAAARACAASRLWFSPASAEHLLRGGRAGRPEQRVALAAQLSSVLTARPVLQMTYGELVPVARARTTARLTAVLGDLVEQQLSAAGPRHAVVVHHVGVPDQAQELARSLSPRTGTVDVRVTELGAVLASHVGPGALGVAVVPLP